MSAVNLTSAEIRALLQAVVAAGSRPAAGLCSAEKKLHEALTREKAALLSLRSATGSALSRGWRKRMR